MAPSITCLWRRSESGLEGVTQGLAARLRHLNHNGAFELEATATAAQHGGIDPGRRRRRRFVSGDLGGGGSGCGRGQSLLAPLALTPES